MSSPGGPCGHFHPTIMAKVVSLPSSPSGTGSEFDVTTENFLNQNFDPQDMHTASAEEEAQIEEALEEAENLPTTYVHHTNLNSDIQTFFELVQ